jgi:hypothetical protein
MHHFFEVHMFRIVAASLLLTLCATGVFAAPLTTRNIDAQREAEYRAIFDSSQEVNSCADRFVGDCDEPTYEACLEPDSYSTVIGPAGTIGRWKYKEQYGNCHGTYTRWKWVNDVGNDADPSSDPATREFACYDYNGY